MLQELVLLLLGAKQSSYHSLNSVITTPALLTLLRCYGTASISEDLVRDGLICSTRLLPPRRAALLLLLLNRYSLYILIALLTLSSLIKLFKLNGPYYCWKCVI